MSPEASSEPGRWKTARNETQRAIMDAVSDPLTHTVVVMSSAQVGKTETLLNILGFYIERDPCPILALQPTLDMAKAFSKDRFATMLRDTPVLHGKVKDPRARDSGNTVLHKVFPGGHVTMAGANSPSSLASRPVRLVLADEVDRYPASAGTEGDPVTLARKRTTTFWNRKLVLTSTPTVKGESRIEKAYQDSDRRRFWVPCPDCGHEQTLIWSQVRWPEGEPQAAEYSCVECGTLWDDAARWAAIRKGEWRGEAPFKGIAGFHLNELYSPWTRLSDTATAFLEAQGDPEMLQAWVNTALGETWEERGDTVDAEGLRALCEVYGPEDLPEWVKFATAGVDVQDDRLEVEVVGWGDDERSAGIEYRVLYGDPSQPAVWEDLDEILTGQYRNDLNRAVRIIAACVDSGGHFSEAVYRFCRARFRRRVFAIKGAAGPRPVWPKTAGKTKTRDNVWLVGVDTAKEAIYARFKIDEDGPGKCILPADPALGYDDQWFEQVTSEEKHTRYREGKPYTVWVLPSKRRNEALDCRVYAYAALKSLPKGASTKAPIPQNEQPRRAPPPTPFGYIERRDDWLR